MFIIDAEIGDVILFDGLRWVVLDKVNDGTLCILEDSVGADKFDMAKWKGSNVCEFLNTKFSSKLHIDSMKNNYHDTKVMLLTEAQLRYYRDVIPRLDENWWLMPEADGLRASTGLNESIRCNSCTSCEIRPIVTFKRFEQAQSVFSQPLNEEIIPVMSVMRETDRSLAQLNQGDRFEIKDEHLTVLESVEGGYKCLVHTPFCMSDVADGFNENWLEAETIKDMTACMEEFFEDSLIPYRMNLQALDGTCGDEKESKNVLASVMDYGTFVRYRDMIPSCNMPWFLGTIYSYNDVKALCVKPDKTIGIINSNFLVFPVVALKYTTKVVVCQERDENLWEINARMNSLKSRIKHLEWRKNNLNSEMDKVLGELNDLEEKASCLSQGI